MGPILVWLNSSEKESGTASHRIASRARVSRHESIRCHDEASPAHEATLDASSAIGDHQCEARSRVLSAATQQPRDESETHRA